MHKPCLAITMGDPAGVGPEVIAGVWNDAAVHDVCRPLVAGHPEIMRRAIKLLGRHVEVVEIASPAEASPGPRAMPCLPVVRDDVLAVPPCTVDARAGQAAYDALMSAARLALAGRVDGLVTAPLHKGALWQAGHHYPGHTELLAELCGVDDFAMMLYLPPGPHLRGPAGLGVIHVTLHMALAEVFGHLTTDAVMQKIRLADGVLRALKGSAPAIGVCALNPHAGESGLFGQEESKIIEPAVARCRGEGVNVSGPWPTDTLMVRARDGEFDGVVAMYHDQGHIALKLLGMHGAVNVTLGLPIVRTSVAHGTAFDRAWQGTSETSGMIAALRVAADMAGRGAAKVR